MKNKRAELKKLTEYIATGVKRGAREYGKSAQKNNNLEAFSAIKFFRLFICSSSVPIGYIGQKIEMGVLVELPKSVFFSNDLLNKDLFYEYCLNKHPQLKLKENLFYCGNIILNNTLAIVLRVD